MPPKDITKRRAYQNQYYDRKAQRIRDIKEASPCTDCKGYFPFYVMQFDHLEGKTRNVSHMRTYSLERVLAEISKCELVCANCHATRTYNRLSVAQLDSVPCF